MSGGQGEEGVLEYLTRTPQKKGGRLFCISDYETGNFISFILKMLKELLKVILLLKLPYIWKLKANGHQKLLRMF